ncbi:MAG: gamma-glutamylputrescine oxidase [Hyphomicrobiaceae bacterium]|jgi:gamma-glutamylputrescine oxidase
MPEFANQNRSMAVSPWLDPPATGCQLLEGNHKADVCVIGAGLTGLSTALALASEGARVVVVESQYAGFGASGRNAGHLTSQIGKDLPTLARMYGTEKVRALLLLAETAVDEVERLINHHDIQCDYKPVGNVLAAVDSGQFRTLDRAAETARRFGVPFVPLDGRAMRARGLPSGFLHGGLEPHGGVLDPGRYVLGLRDAAREAGVVIYESSPVVAIDDAKPAIVRTAAGEVHAETVVVGVNGYAYDLPIPGRARRLVLPIYVQLLRTDPLNPAQRARIDWKGEEGVYTAHELLESWRMAADGSIVGGSKIIRYGYGGGRLRDRDGAVAQELDAVFRRRFPALADVDVASHWGGRIAMTLDFLPAVGRAGRAGNILYSTGYAGHGLALASYAGTMIADLLAGREGPGAALWGRRSFALPPEPLRWMAFQALSRMFAAFDRRIDRRLT